MVACCSSYVGFLTSAEPIVEIAVVLAVMLVVGLVDLFPSLCILLRLEALLGA